MHLSANGTKRWPITFSLINLSIALAGGATTASMVNRGIPQSVAISIGIPIMLIGLVGAFIHFVCLAERGFTRTLKTNSILFAFFVTALVITGLFTIRPDKMRAYTVFDDSISRFAELQPSRGGTLEKGAVLPILLAGSENPPGTTTDKPQLDATYFRLSAQERAASPEDVKTVVWLKFHIDEVGRYDTGGRALQVVCEATAIDVQTSKSVAKATFRGTRPSASVTQANEAPQDHYGDFDDDRIVRYLKQLANGIDRHPTNVPNSQNKRMESNG